MGNCSRHLQFRTQLAVALAVGAGGVGCGDADLVQTGAWADIPEVAATDAAVDGPLQAVTAQDATASAQPDASPQPNARALPPVCPAGPPCTCPVGTDGAACSDGNPCTFGELCQGGACQGGKPVLCSAGTPCGIGTCSPLTGGCSWQLLPTGTPCDDGNACTQADACTATTCTGVAITCDDGNPCTADTCTATAGCVHTNSAAACSDGNACTQGDTCTAGSCTGAQLAGSALCNDANPCTLDQCDATVGCVHPPTSGSCDDGDPCTLGDYCKAGKCQTGSGGSCVCQSDADCADYDDGDLCNGVVYCDFLVPGHACKIKAGSVVQCPSTVGKPCLASGCDAKTGKCAVKQLTGPCDDGDACSGWSQCAAGQCVGELPADCSDGNPCTQDGCATPGGCWHKPLADGTPCGDGLVVCAKLQCVKPCKLFEAVIGGNSFDFLNAVAAAPGGGWLAAGATAVEGLGKQGWLVRYGDNNVQQWQLAVGATATDQFSAVAAAPSGFCAAGDTGTADGNTAGWVVRFDPAGKIIWQAMLGAGEQARLYGAIATSQNCIVAGHRTPPEGPMGQGWVLALGPTGDILWQTTLGFQSNDGLQAIGGLGPAGLLTVGWSITAGKDGDSDAWLVRLAANGDVTWSKQVGSPYYESVGSLLLTGEYFYAGGSAAGPNLEGYDGYLVASHVSGAVQWQKFIGWGKDDRFHGLAVLPTGGAMLAVGESDSFGKGDTDGWVVRLDSGGKVQWTKTFGSTKNDFLSAVAPISDGGIIAVGTYGGAGPNGELGPNGWVLRLDSTASTACE